MRKIILFLLIGSLSCVSELQDVREASIALATQLSDERDSIPAPELNPVMGQEDCQIQLGPPGQGPRLRLFVDATESMAGFVGDRGSVTEFDDVITRLASDLGISRILLFGVTQGAPSTLLTEEPFAMQLRDRSTFSRLNNPDYCLYNALRTSDDSHTSFYFTDGVQSAREYGVISPTAQSLGQWLRDGRGLAILAFRGPFFGRGWSEQARSWITEEVNVEDRPFYAFVLGPDQESIDVALDRLSENIRRRVFILRFGENPIRCRPAATARRQFDWKDPTWELVPASIIQMLDPETYMVFGEYRCDIPVDYPLSAVLARTNFDYRPWDGRQKSFGSPKDPPAGMEFRGDSLTWGPSGSTVFLAGFVPISSDSRFGFLHLRVEGQPGDLRPMVRDLSTDSDLRAEDFNRTFRFDWLIEHLVRSHLGRPVDVQDLFITVQYR